jgi:molecular chaperone DnaK
LKRERASKEGPMGRMIGIDLGTTNSCVAFMDGRRPQVISNRQAQRTTPSVVSFTPDGRVLVGSTAQRQATQNPGCTIHGAKRLMGRKYDAPELQPWKRLVPYAIVAAENGDAWVKVGDRRYSPQEISAFVLEELKIAAETYLGEPVTSATVTVPAYFNDAQRQATRDAGKIAGLAIDNILNEPTAAALGYGLDDRSDQTLAVFDLGGGTFDITILQKSGDVFEVLSTHGDTFLGGDDFDSRLVAALTTDFERRNQIRLTHDPAAMYRIKEVAEATKRDLSTVETTPIHIPFLAMGPAGPLHIEYTGFSRRSLEMLCADLLDRLGPPCQIALDGARLSVDELDQVLLVGGMTRMPAVRRKVAEVFPGVRIRADVNPDEIVALGAATQCGILSGQLDDIALLDVTPYALGVLVKGNRVSHIIPKNCTIPTSVTRTYATTAEMQNAVLIEVFQGESEAVEENSYLGCFELGDLPLRPAGHVQVDVIFELNADGMLQVTAREISLGKQASVKLTPSGGLSKAEVQSLAASHGG